MNQAEFNEQKLTERLHLEMSYADAIILLGNLTLVLRHPKNVGSSTEVIKVIGATLASCILSHLEGHVPDQILDNWQKAGFINSANRESIN